MLFRQISLRLITGNFFDAFGDALAVPVRRLVIRSFTFQEGRDVGRVVDGDAEEFVTIQGAFFIRKERVRSTGRRAAAFDFDSAVRAFSGFLMFEAVRFGRLRFFSVLLAGFRAPEPVVAGPLR